MFQVYSSSYARCSACNAELPEAEDKKIYYFVPDDKTYTYRHNYQIMNSIITI